MNWWERICYSGTAAEGSGGDPPPPPPPPPARAAPPPAAPPPLRRQAEYEDDPPPPAPRRTPADQIAEIRAEAAQYRISAKQAREERDDALEQARLAKEELESAKTKAIQPLQVRLEKAQQRAVTSAIRAEMMALGLQDEDLIHLHTKMPEPPKVSVDDEFEVTGAKELAAAFKKWKPDYFKKAAEETPPPNRNNGRQPPPPRKTSEGNEPPPAEGDGPAIDLRDRTKYPPGSAAYRAAQKAVLAAVGRR